MEDKPSGILEGPLIMINIGVRAFAESLERQGQEVAQVDWVPPAAGDQQMIDLLEELS